MESSLTIFEGHELEILTKEDVNFKFDGTVLFNGKQSATILEYKNDRDALNKHVRDEQKFKLKNSDVVKCDFRKLNNAGETFVNEKGIMKLIINSNMPKANEFEDQVWDIITKVQQTGKFDIIEEKLKLIEDEKERELSLSLYSLKQAVKLNPNDMLSVLAYNNTKNDLNAYKQSKELELVNNKIQKIEQNNNKIADDVDMIKRQQIYVCNRTNFNEKVKILANKYFGRDMQETYNQLFNKMRLLGSFDVFAHRKNEWKLLNAERVKENKNPYKISTLKHKINYLDIINKFDKWELCSEAYKTIETELAA